MKNPRRAGDAYEKHLEGTITHVSIWDHETKGWITKPMGEVFSLVSGSGSSYEKKGDLKSESYLLQAKRTDKKSFTVKLDDLRKAEREAMNLGKKPLFVVGFYAGDRVTDEWVFFPKWAFDGR